MGEFEVFEYLRDVYDFMRFFSFEYLRDVYDFMRFFSLNSFITKLDISRLEVAADTRRRAMK